MCQSLYLTQNYSCFTIATITKLSLISQILPERLRLEERDELFSVETVCVIFSVKMALNFLPTKEELWKQKQTFKFKENR